MPGQTNSQTILAAGNQEVIALNELVSAVSALRIVVQRLNFCCTTTPPATPEPGTPGGGSPGDPPGSGQTDPPGTTQEKATRRCKIAMWLVDNYLNGIVEWGDKSGIDLVINGAVEAGLGLAATTIASIAGAAVAAVLSQFVTPGPDPGDPVIIIFGWAISGYIAWAMTTGGSLDFAALKSFINDNRVKLICALTNSQNAYSAHSALMSAIDDTSPGLDPGNRRFVDRMLSTAILALLFYVDEQFQVLEDWIAEQPDTCACTETPPETGTPTNEYKCKAANYLFDNFTESFNNWGSIATMTWYSTPNFISALAGGLLISLMGPLYAVAIVGWNMLAKIVSFLGTIFWSGFDYFTAFEEIANQFENNKAAVICELYLAADVDTVRTELENRIDDYVGNVMTAHPEWADQADTYKDTLKSLLPNDVLNVLFETTPRSEITNYAPEDFTECLCAGGGCTGSFDFASSASPFVPYISGGGADGTCTHENGHLVTQRTTTAQGGRYAGWRWVMGNYVVADGDAVAIDTSCLAGNDPYYLQANFTDNTIAYVGHADNYERTMTLDLSAYAGKTIAFIWFYLEGGTPYTRTFDNFSYTLCGTGLP